MDFFRMFLTKVTDAGLATFVKCNVISIAMATSIASQLAPK
jgi:hypothetical protein